MYSLKVSLWVKPDKINEFERFEKHAFKVMKQYGAVISKVERIGVFTEQTPFEIHWIDFPSKAAFQNYREDKAILEFAHLRAESITKTELEVLPHS